MAGKGEAAVEGRKKKRRCGLGCSRLEGVDFMGCFLFATKPIERGTNTRERERKSSKGRWLQWNRREEAENGGSGQQGEERSVNRRYGLSSPNIVRHFSVLLLCLCFCLAPPPSFLIGFLYWI